MTSNKICVFNGATALVTGGASGIGRALAGELAKRGAERIFKRCRRIWESWGRISVCP